MPLRVLWAIVPSLHNWYFFKNPYSCFTPSPLLSLSNCSLTISGYPLNPPLFQCDRGCSHGRIFTKKQSRSAQITAAFKDGQTFWINSATDNGTDGKSIIDSVEILCINPSISDSVTGFVDSLTAKIAGIIKADFVAPVRYIVQWKQMVLLRGGISEETKWITASVSHFHRNTVIYKFWL